jgi:hypothetical protein
LSTAYPFKNGVFETESNSLRDVEPTANLILDDFGMDDDGGDDPEEGAAP